MGHTFVVSHALVGLPTGDGLSLLVKSILRLIFGEDTVSMAHGLEHGFMLDFAFPNLLFLLLNLLGAIVGVSHISRMFEQLRLHLGSGVGLHVCGLRFDPSVVVPPRLFLRILLFLGVAVG